jgi:F-type H+/Na+-transporting ATPase subunit beta
MLGGTVGFVAHCGMGQLVLLAEIFFRMKEKEFVTIFVIPKEDHAVDDVMNASKFTIQLNKYYTHIWHISSINYDGFTLG